MTGSSHESALLMKTRLYTQTEVTLRESLEVCMFVYMYVRSTGGREVYGPVCADRL